MRSNLAIYDIDPSLRLSRAVDQTPGPGQNWHRVQRLRRSTPGGRRVLAAFGGDHLLGQAQQFLEARGTSPGDLLVVHLDHLAQADSLLALLQLVHRSNPEVRALASPSPEALHRLVWGQSIGIPEQIIVDARVEGHSVYLTDAELNRHVVDARRVRPLQGLSVEALARFELDANGRFIAWPAMDVEMTLHGLRQASDEAYLANTRLADVQRAAHYGAAIRRLREAAGIRQADVPGLSERQLRRLESGQAQPTADSMHALADRHGLALNAYLDRVAEECRVGASATPD